MQPNQTSNRRRRTQAGVTLIEMLVVVTIIAVFAAVVGPKLLSKAGAAKRTAARQQIMSFTTALGAYKLDTSLFPTNEQGLAALRTKPENVTGWQGPYMTQEIPTDPWSRPFIYKYPGDHGDEPDIVSLGADGQPGGVDEAEDIVSWKSK
jgi:general secretion pathway protein G